MKNDWLNGTACGPGWGMGSNTTFLDRLDAIEGDSEQDACFSFRLHSPESYYGLGKIFYLHSFPSGDVRVLLVTLLFALFVSTLYSIKQRMKRSDGFTWNDGMMSCAEAGNTQVGRASIVAVCALTLCAWLHRIFATSSVAYDRRKYSLLWSAVNEVTYNGVVFSFMVIWWVYTHTEGSLIGRSEKYQKKRWWRGVYKLKFFRFEKRSLANRVVSYSIFLSFFIYFAAVALLLTQLTENSPAVVVASSKACVVVLEAAHSWMCVANIVISVDFLAALFYHRNLRKRSAKLKGLQGRMTRQLNDQSKALAFVLAALLLKNINTLSVYVFNKCPYEAPEDNARGDPYESVFLDLSDFMGLAALCFLLVSDQHPRSKGMTKLYCGQELRLVTERAYALQKVSGMAIAVLFYLFTNQANRLVMPLENKILAFLGCPFSILAVNSIVPASVAAVPLTTEARTYLLKYETGPARIRKLVSSMLLSACFFSHTGVWFSVFWLCKTMGTKEDMKKGDLWIRGYGTFLLPVMINLCQKVLLLVYWPNYEYKKMDKLQVLDGNNVGADGHIRVRKENKLTKMGVARQDSTYFGTLSSPEAKTAAEKVRKAYSHIFRGIRANKIKDKRKSSSGFQQREYWSNMATDFMSVVEGFILYYLAFKFFIHALSLFLFLIYVAYILYLWMNDWIWSSGGDDESADEDKEKSGGEEGSVSKGPKPALYARRVSRDAIVDSSPCLELVIDGYTAEEPNEPAVRPQSKRLELNNKDGSSHFSMSSAASSAASSAPSNSWRDINIPGLLLYIGVCLLAWAASICLTHLSYMGERKMPLYENSPFIIGHRGVMAEGVPECSLAAADMAKSFGIDAVEIDVVTSKDDHLVIMHDYTLERTTDVRRAQTKNASLPRSTYVKSWTLAELRMLRLRKHKCDDDLDANCFSNETVPTLLEYLAHLGRIGIKANVEIKPSGGSRYIASILDTICEAGMESQSMIAASYKRYQQTLGLLQPHVSVESDFLYHVQANSQAVPSNADIFGINGEFLLFNPWVISQAHKNEKYALVYFITEYVESAWMYDFFRRLGIDMIMVNDPTICEQGGVCPSGANRSAFPKNWLPSP